MLIQGSLLCKACSHATESSAISAARALSRGSEILWTASFTADLYLVVSEADSAAAESNETSCDRHFLRQTGSSDSCMRRRRKTHQIPQGHRCAIDDLAVTIFEQLWARSWSAGAS